MGAAKKGEFLLVTMMRGCALLLVVCAVFVQADIPVHCLHKHIVGEWTFHRGGSNNPHTHVASCNKAGKYLGGGDFGLGEANFKTSDKIQVKLASPNFASAKINGKTVKGTWTMMYDEGFEVLLGNQKYFAFSKYTKTSVKSKHSVSHCDKTFPGWFHADPEKNTWGCYYGVKSTPVAPQKYRRFGDGKSEGFRRNEDGDIVAPLRSTRGHTARHAMPTEDDGNDEDYSEELLQVGASQVLPEVQGRHNFYHDQAKVVDAVNAGHRRGDHTWHATDYPMRAISTMGTVRHPYKGLGEEGENSELLEEISSFRKTAAAKVDVSDLPKHFDWAKQKNTVPEVRDQKCGSCYAFSTLDMMESRMRILTKNKNKNPMSYQSVLSCNRYSQGCAGGFPYTVAKLHQNVGVMSEKDQPSNYDWHSSRGSRSMKHLDKVKCKKNAKPMARAWNYKYIGGFYGATNEKAMRRDLFAHGPLAVCFQVGLGFGNYKGGIFRQEARLPRQNHWDRVNHAVLITGWGHDNGHKYWKVKNSWGPQWGDKGYFKIERGSNQLNIESDAVALYPSKGESLRSSTRMSLRSSMGSEMLLEAAAAKVLTTTAEESLLQVEEDAEEPAWITGEDDNRDEE